MGFSRKIKYYLVHTLKYSNKDAQALLDSRAVEVDGQIVTDNRVLDERSPVHVKGQTVRVQTTPVYLKFHKPPGYESSLNPKIENNIAGFFGNPEGLAIAGRLDKASQGLMLLSNDGGWVEKMCNPKFEKEKEYLVTLNKEMTVGHRLAFETGVTIGDYTTLPCRCHRVSETTINVTLTEGKNRQIRRMCAALGYKVLKLERIRVGEVFLGELSSGAHSEIEK